MLAAINRLLCAVLSWWAKEKAWVHILNPHSNTAFSQAVQNRFWGGKKKGGGLGGVWSYIWWLLWSWNSRERKGLVFAIHSREFNLRLMCWWLEMCIKYPDAREMGTENSKINTGYWLIYSEGWFPKPGTLGMRCLPWFCVSLIWLGYKHRASQLLNHCPRPSQGWTQSRPEQTSRQTTKEKQLFCLAAALFLLHLASEQVNLGAQSSLKGSIAQPSIPRFHAACCPFHQAWGMDATDKTFFYSIV